MLLDGIHFRRQKSLVGEHKAIENAVQEQTPLHQVHGVKGYIFVETVGLAIVPEKEELINDVGENKVDDSQNVHEGHHCAVGQEHQVVCEEPTVDIENINWRVCIALVKVILEQNPCVNFVEMRLWSVNLFLFIQLSFCLRLALISVITTFVKSKLARSISAADVISVNSVNPIFLFVGVVLASSIEPSENSLNNRLHKFANETNYRVGDHSSTNLRTYSKVPS